MEKKLYWLVESNADLSNTVHNLEQAKELIQGDFDNEDEKEEVEYTITPVWYTDDEYANLPED